MLTASAAIVSLFATSSMMLFVLTACGIGVLALLIGLLAIFEMRSRKDEKGEWIAFFAIFIAYTILSLTFIGIAHAFLFSGLAVVFSIFFIAIGLIFMFASCAPAIRTIGVVAIILTVVFGLAVIKVHQLRVDSRRTNIMNKLRIMGSEADVDELQRIKRIRKATEKRNYLD